MFGLGCASAVAPVTSQSKTATPNLALIVLSRPPQMGAAIRTRISRRANAKKSCHSLNPEVPQRSLFWKASHPGAQGARNGLGLGNRPPRSVPQGEYSAYCAHGLVLRRLFRT